MTFDDLCENISGIDYKGDRYGKAIDGISAWYFESEYDRFIGSDYVSDGVEIEYNGVKYVDHWFFVNEEHESNVIAYSLLPVEGDGDVIFYICGCKLDRVCSFDEMIEYLQSDIYFVDDCVSECSYDDYMEWARAGRGIDDDAPWIK